MSIERDISNFTQLLNNISDTVNLSTEEISANAAALRTILTNHASPSSELKLLSYGSFKETYLPAGVLKSNEAKFVIKFASWQNKTCEEIEILNHANAAGLDDFFVPTYYMHIYSTDLPIYALDDDTYDDEPDLTLTDICVQPIVTTNFETGDSFPVAASIFWTDRAREEAYNKLPLMNDSEKISFKDARRFADLLNIHAWWQTALGRYGLDKCLALCDFIKKYGLDDLTPDNVGCMKSQGVIYPVILDWLSWRPAG